MTTLIAFEYRFIGGSMGSVVGERFVRGVNLAIEERRPFICFSASGGARMQEALLSLLHRYTRSLRPRRGAALLPDDPATQAP